MGHRVLAGSSGSSIVADGHDKKVWILDRSSLEVLGSFGDGGRYPGQFYGVGSVAVDSKGNVYTGETYEGKRVQKFVNKSNGRRNVELQWTSRQTRRPLTVDCCSEDAYEPRVTS